MPNGKGTLDCDYCIFFVVQIPKQPDQEYANHYCSFHETKLPHSPDLHLNRICCHFEPKDDYFMDNGQFFPPARRFSWFPTDLKPGVLYLFHYNTPENIEKSIVMRIPDYEKDTWYKPKEDIA